MNQGQSNFGKFKTTLYNKTRFFGPIIVKTLLKQGLFGEARSLLGGWSNKEEVIKFLKSLSLVTVDVYEIEQFQTENGFDFAAFLNYLIEGKKLTSLELKKLENFIYVKEFKTNPEQILKNFNFALDVILANVSTNGAGVLNYTSYYLISFLCIYAARDVNFRMAYQDLLTNIASKISAINKKKLEASEKNPVVYKGVTIKLFGNNMEILEKGLQKVMYAIDSLPMPLLKQLALTDGIRVTEFADPANLYTLMSRPKHREDPNITTFFGRADYLGSLNRITIYDINTASAESLITTFAHELGHALDYHMLSPKGYYFTEDTKIWEDAKKADGNSISGYGDKFIAEDFADTCEFYTSALKDKKRIDDFRANYPNRVRILEAVFDLRMYDPSNPESLPKERKFEIMRLFENYYTNAMELLLGNDEIARIHSLPPEGKINVINEMIQNGVPLQFLHKFMYGNFFEGFSTAQLREVFEAYGSTSYQAQFELFFCISTFATSAGLVNDEELFSKLGSIVPKSPKDELVIVEFQRTIQQVPGEYYYGLLLRTAYQNMSYDLFLQLSDLFFSGLGRGR